ncbi:MAG TPA: hypothetical protein VLL05_06700 [Terriglobales bacterium]|nr:hypothetical protein [Terriglobales bacterium]
MVVNTHEEAFVKAFVENQRQQRFLSFLGDPKKRVRFVREFDHLKSSFLDARFVTRLRGTPSLSPSVYSTLRKLGAPKKCWVMGGRFDNQEKELLDALTNSGDGFALSCIAGRLAYVQSEDEDLLLQR